MLVRDETGKILASGLSITLDENGWMIDVIVESASSAFLTVTREQTRALLDEGLNRLQYTNGEAALCIDLTQMTDAWFGTGSAVTAYCFVLAEGEAGMRVTVYAETAEGKAEAVMLNGVTLIRDGKRTAVMLNGVY